MGDAACVEAHGKEGIGRFGLSVSNPLIVWTPGEVRIVEVDAGARVDPSKRGKPLERCLLAAALPITAP